MENLTGLKAPGSYEALDLFPAEILQAAKEGKEAVVLSNTEHNNPELDFIGGDGLPNTVKLLDISGEVLTRTHDSFPLGAPLLNKIFNAYDAAQPLIMKNKELARIMERAQALSMEIFNTVVTENPDSDPLAQQRIKEKINAQIMEIQEKLAPVQIQASKIRIALTRKAQEETLEQLKDDLPALIDAIRLDIGIFAYRQLVFQQEDNFYDTPPDGRPLESAAFAKKRLEQYSFTSIRQQLQQNLIAAYGGIGIYWNYIKENDRASWQELKDYRDAVLRIASTLSPEREKNRRAWEKLLIERGTEKPTEQVGQLTPIYDRVSPFDKVTQKLFQGAIEVGKNVGVKTGTDRKTGKSLRAHTKIKAPANTAPLDAFDRAVNAACYSLYKAGNNIQSFAGIARAMTGKGPEYNPSSNLTKEIQQSCLKQMGTIVSIDTTEEMAYYKNLKATYARQLFTADMVMAEYDNDEKAGAIRFFRIPLNAEYADDKSHIEKTDLKLLDTGMPQTTENIMLQEILLDRILVIKRTARGMMKDKNYIDYESVINELMEQLERRAAFDEKNKNKAPAKNATRVRSIKKKRIKEKIPQFLDAWKGRLFSSYKEIIKNDKRKTVIGARIQRLTSDDETD